MEFLLSYQSTIASRILIIEFIFECFESLTFFSIYTDAQLANSKIKRDYVTFIGFSTAGWLQWEGKIT